MVDDRELWACALKLISQHGAGAWYVAAKQAEDLLDAGDVRGNDVFLAIACRVEQLMTIDPSAPLH